MKQETKICQHCNKEFSRKDSGVSRESRTYFATRKYCSRQCVCAVMQSKTKGKPAWNKGLPAPWVSGEKNGNWNGGIWCIDCNKRLTNQKREPENTRCRKCSSKFYSGKNSWNFKHGLSQSRTTYEYEMWRKAIYKRDHYHCAMCSKHCNGDINAHHIIRYIDAPEFRHELCNGITLCFECHLKTRAKEDYYAPLFLNILATRESNRFTWSHN